MKRSVAIVGAGAVGCYYGGRLAQHGHPVHFLFRSGFDAVRAGGLVVHSAEGDFNIPPDRLLAYRRPEEMPKVDLVIVTLKTTANDQYRPLISPLLHDQTLILTLQNGLGNEEQLASLFGAGRVLGGLAFVCINRMPDGSISHTDHGLIKIGEIAGPPLERTRQIVEMLSACRITCQALENLAYGRWEKLVWNVPFNGLGAVLNKSTDRLIATAEGRSLVKGLMLEVMQIATGLGIDLPADLADRKIDQTRSMGAYRTSMQIDRQHDRPLEIDAILRRPLAAAENLGITTPYLKALYEMATLP